MRLVHIAGFASSGKTSLIERICNEDTDFIANNEQSSESLRNKCRNVDFFPFKSPCARVRQYSYRVDLMKEKDSSIVITEPPGNCLEVSAPMLNHIYVNDKSIELGPLMTVMDGRRISEGISKRTSEGLRLFNMADESDVIVVTFSDMIDDSAKGSIVDVISSINEDAKVIFSEPNGDVSEIRDIVFGDARYSRPLYN